MFCTQCGTTNDVSARFCRQCGMAIEAAPIGANAAVKSSSASLSITDEEFYKAFIGPKNQNYYLKHFALFDTQGKPSVTWHWPAFIITFYWMLYRKMWLPALLYFLSPYLIMIPIGIIGAVTKSDELTGLAYLAWLAAMFVFPPLFANSLYYKRCKKEIAAVKASSSDPQRQLGELTGKGGTSNVVAIIIAILAFVTIIGILAAIALPAYQDYTTRARTAEALSYGQKATDAVSHYYATYESVPSNLATAGFNLTPPSFINSAVIDSKNGVVSLAFSQSPIEGKSLHLIPSLDSNDRLVWTCKSQDIPDKYLPQACRSK